MANTGLITHPHCLLHDTGPSHPERSQRLSAVLDRLGQAGIADEVERIEAHEVDPEDLLAVHPAEHVQQIERLCAAGPGRIDGTDTAVSPDSHRAALLAAGGVAEAARRVRLGEWTNAFVAVRPPGHHAEAREAMGFCLFNSVAVGAAALLRDGAERVAILDWDVHHGNGTQHLFETNPRVFYASLHQWPLYPGTGAAAERGSGPGAGTTLNCPMPALSTDAQWLGALEHTILPALEDFAPEAVLISAGFDAHRADPLAQCLVSSEAFGAMTRLMTQFADAHAGGALVSVLEGGYDIDALADSALHHVEALVEASR